MGIAWDILIGWGRNGSGKQWWAFPGRATRVPQGDEVAKALLCLAAEAEA